MRTHILAMVMRSWRPLLWLVLAGPALVQLPARGPLTHAAPRCYQASLQGASPPSPPDRLPDDPPPPPAPARPKVGQA